MRIVSQKELGFLPNGTVISEIIDPEFYKGTDGDMEIGDLCIITGHSNNKNDHYSVEKGHFNGCLHMAGNVRVCRDDHGNFIYDDEDVKLANDWSMITDTCEYDFNENHMYVVYDRNEVETMVDNLKWALDQYH